jgi:diguanylate cyclase (GGDEF)-like protein
LSGVANRRAFLDGASGLLARHEIEFEPLALLLFDLDHFKQINDRFGHAVGDAVLQTFAATGTATLGADVLFARIGGEEFASCLRVGDLDEAFAIADRVRRNFATAADKFGNGELLPTVSVGVTLGCDANATCMTCWRGSTGRSIAPKSAGAIVWRLKRRPKVTPLAWPLPRPRSCRSLDLNGRCVRRQCRPVAARRILRRQYRGNVSVLFQEKAAPLFGYLPENPLQMLHAWQILNSKRSARTAH